VNPPIGYLAVGRDRDPSLPWLAGEVLEVYPVLETIDEFVVKARALSRMGRVPAVVSPAPLDIDAYGREWAVALGAIEPAPRVQRQRGCTCSKKGRQTPLVKAYASAAGIWVWVRGNRIPNTARGETAHLHETDTAWPLGWFEVLRPQITRCPVCHSYWAVMLQPTAYRLVRLGVPQFLATVTE
jgi:hypothetical protein